MFDMMSCKLASDRPLPLPPPVLRVTGHGKLYHPVRHHPRLNKTHPFLFLHVASLPTVLKKTRVVFLLSGQDKPPNWDEPNSWSQDQAYVPPSNSGCSNTHAGGVADTRTCPDGNSPIEVGAAAVSTFVAVPNTLG